jgi:hypothetical protein
METPEDANAEKRRDYTIEFGDKSLKLKINGILHLSIKRNCLVAVQAWELGGQYCIEYTTTTGVVMTEYNKADKWLTILKLLDQHEIYA